MRRALQDRFDCQEAASREEAVDLVRDVGSIDVAIIDMRRHPDRTSPRPLGATETIRIMLKSEPGLGIVAHGERAERHLASAAMQAGASAYISRTASTELLLHAAQAALAQERFIDPAVPPRGSRGCAATESHQIPPPGAEYGPASGTFRTVCVRTCDGAYFPVSFATVQARFPDDEKTCKALCPATEASLFTYRNPGEDINQAVSIAGQTYSSLPNAFKFRNEFNPSCACKAVGQTWSDALKSVEDKAAAEQQGDIIVTEESARKMQQRAQPGAKTTPAKKGAAPAATTATAPPAAATAPAADSTAATDEKKAIRTVGPTFIPPKQ